MRVREKQNDREREKEGESEREGNSREIVEVFKKWYTLEYFKAVLKNGNTCFIFLFSTGKKWFLKHDGFEENDNCIINVNFQTGGVFQEILDAIYIDSS